MISSQKLPDGRQMHFLQATSPPLAQNRLTATVPLGFSPYGFDERPWGTWQEFAKNEECTIRILNVDPDEMLSDQRHQQRDELYVVLDHDTLVQLDGHEIRPDVGDIVFIPSNTWHRLICPGKSRIRVLEVAFGHYDQENDIERRADKYQRPLTGEGIGAQ